MGYVIRGTRTILSKNKQVYCKGMHGGKMDSWTDNISDAHIFASQNDAEMCKNMTDGYARNIEVVQVF